MARIEIFNKKDKNGFGIKSEGTRTVDLPDQVFYNGHMFQYNEFLHMYTNKKYGLVSGEEIVKSLSENSQDEELCK